MAPVVSAVELTKRFGDITAASDLSFDIDAGSVTPISDATRSRRSVARLTTDRHGGSGRMDVARARHTVTT
jgi:hypothetical protein